MAVLGSWLAYAEPIRIKHSKSLMSVLIGAGELGKNRVALECILHRRFNSGHCQSFIAGIVMLLTILVAK